MRASLWIAPGISPSETIDVPARCVARGASCVVSPVAARNPSN